MSSNTKTTASDFHSVTPHMVCRDVDAAIAFYQKALGAEELFRLNMPNGKIMHAQIRIGNSIIMMMEENEQFFAFSPLSLKGTPISLHLYLDNVDEAFKKAVNAGMTVRMEPQDMFWGDRYGALSDPFGHNWTLATQIRDVSLEERQKACDEFCK